jgi:hypothetical protein
VSSLLGMRTKRSISTAVGHAMCLPAIMRVQRCSVGNSVPAVHSKFCVSSYMLLRACTLYNHNHNHKSYKNNITFFGLDVVSQTNIYMGHDCLPAMFSPHTEESKTNTLDCWVVILRWWLEASYIYIARQTHVLYGFQKCSVSFVMQKSLSASYV